MDFTKEKPFEEERSGINSLKGQARFSPSEWQRSARAEDAVGNSMWGSTPRNKSVKRVRICRNAGPLLSWERKEGRGYIYPTMVSLPEMQTCSELPERPLLLS